MVLGVGAGAGIGAAAGGRRGAYIGAGAGALTGGYFLWRRHRSGGPRTAGTTAPLPRQPF